MAHFHQSRSPWFVRRPLLAGGLAMLAAALAVLGFGLGRERPHLVVIVVDSLRADARSDSIGAAATPNLDRLAREGFVFHEAFANSSAGLPALVSLLSARLPHESRVTGSERAVPADVTLLAEHLARRGYATGASVALQSLRGHAPGAGIDRGFARFDAGSQEVSPGADAARRAALAIDALDGQGPFFLLAHVADPHGPFEVRSGADSGLGPFSGLRDQYEAAVEEADRAVGAILDELRRRGLYDRCLIVVTSNHGSALGEHGAVGSGTNVHDELLRVPLILRTPHGRSAEALQRLSHRLVQQIDVAPTLLALLGQPPLPGATGRSLLEPGERPLLAEAHPPDAPGTLLALRDTEYKLVLDAARGAFALFHLASDPLELDDVFSRQGHLRAQWQRELTELAGVPTR